MHADRELIPASVRQVLNSGQARTWYEQCVVDVIRHRNSSSQEMQQDRPLRDRDLSLRSFSNRISIQDNIKAIQVIRFQSSSVLAEEVFWVFPSFHDIHNLIAD